MNDSVMISSEKNSAGPTSAADSPITLQRSCPVRLRPGLSACQCSRCLCAFSIMTTAASTMAPTAMAMPPSDMMLALTPWYRITRKAAITPSGSEMIATNAERRWNRNTRHTTATTMNSSISLCVRLSTARLIKPDRS
ncbi:hypothetical protein FZN37_004374 [Enterobacter hormaechei]|nr:hypothetical protein FZN37_004374 [Enterobacter hormaechei]